MVRQPILTGELPANERSSQSRETAFPRTTSQVFLWPLQACIYMYTQKYTSTHTHTMCLKEYYPQRNWLSGYHIKELYSEYTASIYNPSIKRQITQVRRGKRLKQISLQREQMAKDHMERRSASRFSRHTWQPAWGTASYPWESGQEHHKWHSISQSPMGTPVQLVGTTA